MHFTGEISDDRNGDINVTNNHVVVVVVVVVAASGSL
jgi:hypothetical protein